MTTRRTTREQVELLVARGFSSQQIAARLGFHVSHINNLRRKIGIARPKGHQSRLNLPEVEMLARAGASTREIARHFKYRPSYIVGIQRARQKLGLVGRRGTGRLSAPPAVPSKAL